jgi:hypothetical protein
MRIKCEVCEEYGYLQQLKKYYRVRHYDSQAKAKRQYPFYYHQQSKAHVETQLKNIKAENFNKQKSKSNCGHQECSSFQENKPESSLNSSGRSLAWFRTSACHVDDPGSNPGDRTTNTTILNRAYLMPSRNSLQQAATGLPCKASSRTI